MNDRVAWVIWLIFGIMLVVTGFQGSLGKVLACVFCPDIVVINS